jgi:vitamin B12 transporter
MFVLLLFATSLQAQDTIKLIAAEVIAGKYAWSHSSKKSQELEASALEQFRLGSVAELLSFHSPIFIKSYGPGATASTSFRGGSAAHTAVLWNGFNLQNAMLGQTDLSLLPSFLFDNTTIEYGGSSALWGSGAVAGSIQLNNRSAFGKGLSVSTDLGAASFGTFNANTKIELSRERFVSSSKFYLRQSQNDFQYKDPYNVNSDFLRQKNAAYLFSGVFQELRFRMPKNQLLSLNLWANNNIRQLPPVNISAQNKAQQRDAALRLTTDWSLIKKQFKCSIRSAYFNELINFNDSLLAIESRNKTETFILENENFFELSQTQQISLGANVTANTVHSNNYMQNTHVLKTAVLCGYKKFMFDKNLLLLANGRVEYFSAGILPLTGSTGLEYTLGHSVKLSVNAGRVYRQPTLNELYWIPGGNSLLKAEEGYSFEGTINYKIEKERLSLLVSAAAFNRNIDNWILWVPGERGNPSPVNIQEVWSRGTETSWSLKFSNHKSDKRKFTAGLTVNTAYVLSTVQQSKQENSGLAGKQLVYTPRYTANANLYLAIKNSSLHYSHQYNGYRFTTGDNTEWLEPFQLASLRLSQDVHSTGYLFKLFASCNNLYNQSYAIIRGRPMPLRYFEIGLSMQTKIIKQTI